MSADQNRLSAGATQGGVAAGGRFTFKERAADSVKAGELMSQVQLGELRGAARAELDEIRRLRETPDAPIEEIWQREQDLGEAMTRAEIRSKYPTAATLVLANSNEGPGAPWLDPQQILDADGNVLAEYQGDYELTDWIGDWTVMMDRDMDRYELLSSGWFRESTWKFDL